MPLVISRRSGEAIVLELGGERAVVTYVQPPNGNARLVVDAPRSVVVYREELDDPDGRA